MTIIIGVKHKSGVYLATDGRVTDGDSVLMDDYNKQTTAFGATFAFCGSVRALNGAKYVLKIKLGHLESEIKTEEDVYSIYHEMRKHFKDSGYVEAGDGIPLGITIITKGGKLFEVQHTNGAIIEHSNYVCMGSGEAIADVILGIKKINNPKKDIEYAMKETFKRKTSCGGKVLITHYPLSLKKKKGTLTTEVH